MTEAKSCPMCGVSAAADAERCDCGYAFSGALGSNAAVDYDPSAISTGPGDNWRTYGWTMTAIGAAALVVSLMMGTSVDASGPYGGGEVVNIDLQFHKGLAVGGSLFAIGLGVFCVAIGTVLQAVARISNRTDA